MKIERGADYDAAAGEETSENGKNDRRQQTARWRLFRRQEGDNAGNGEQDACPNGDPERGIARKASSQSGIDVEQPNLGADAKGAECNLPFSEARQSVVAARGRGGGRGGGRGVVFVECLDSVAYVVGGRGRGMITGAGGKSLTGVVVRFDEAGIFARALTFHARASAFSSAGILHRRQFRYPPVWIE